MFGRKKHEHGAGCAGCLQYATGQYSNGYDQGKLNTRINLIELKQAAEQATEELRKARLKIDVYERMFSALRIPVLPKEQG